MKNTTLGGYKTINSFVSAKLHRFNTMEHSFASMFELMFSEKENIMFEKSCGYKIEYLTYGQACECINRCAEYFRCLASSIPSDSVIGLYMDNGADWIEAFWSILKGGYRPLLLNTRLSDEILITTMRSAGAVMLVSDGKELPGYPAVRFADVKNCQGEACCEGQFGSEVLVMSSGTTSSPKICAYSAEEFYYQINDSFKIITQCRQIKKHYKGQLKLLTFLPFYHVFGLIAVYVWFAFFSRTFVHLNDFSANTIINTIRRHKVTHIFAVPLFWNEVYRQTIKTVKARGGDTYKKLCRGLELAGKIGDIPVFGSLFIKAAFGEIRDNLFGDSICFMITGGSEINSEVLSFFNLIGYRLANGYGMTEIGITSVELSSKRALLNSGFVGKPLSSVEYTVSSNGCLLVRGKSVARYIIEDGVKTASGDWYDTRDMAECINGHYRILGRRDDVVIAENGENLNPCLIEPLIADDGSYQVCLIKAANNNEVVPVLLVSAGRNLTCEKYEEVHSKIAQKLHSNNLSALIGRIVFVGDPLMDEKDIKVNRKRLSDFYENGRLDIIDPKKTSSANEIDSLIQIYVRDLFAATLEKPASDIGPDSDFFVDEGGTSLDYFAVIAKIQEDYGLNFPATSEKTLTTVRELSEFIEDMQINVD